jgi:hypothetical protein
VLNSKLIQALEKNLNCNLARLKCLSLLVTAVIRHRTVNLTILATTDDGKNVSNETRYRRFQDFFLNFRLCLPSVARVILARVPKPPGGYLLAMDRTNWQFGRHYLNFLVIAIVVGKVSIPVVWRILPPKTKSGNSNTGQRIALTKELLALIPAKDIRVLAMDREFGGKQWLAWLDQQEVGYVVRIKKNTIVGRLLAEEHAKGRGRKPGNRQRIYGVKGLDLFFSCKRMQKDGRATHLFVISNRFQGEEALELYRQRWGIERLFGHLKQKGFDLEATHLSNPAKLEKLFAVVVLAFLFSFAWGCHLRATGRKVSVTANRKSLFRLGLEDLLRLLDPPPNNHPAHHHLRDFLRWFNSGVFTSIFLV